MFIHQGRHKSDGCVVDVVSLYSILTPLATIPENVFQSWCKETEHQSQLIVNGVHDHQRRAFI